jgi:transposase
VSESTESKRAPRPPYPVEFLERVPVLVFEHQDEYPSQWKAIESISAKLKVHHESLRQWVRRAEVDAGGRPGLTTDERARMKELEREVKELRRANEILKAAAHFFGAELDRQQPRTPQPQPASSVRATRAMASARRVAGELAQHERLAQLSAETAGAKLHLAGRPEQSA